METPQNEQQAPPANWEYICVEITRKEGTELYMKVPKGWRPSGRDYKLLGRATKETVRDLDWDNHGWENDVEVEGYQSVEAKNAEQFKIFDALQILTNATIEKNENQRN